MKDQKRARNLWVGAGFVVVLATLAVGRRFLAGVQARAASFREVWRFSRWIYASDVLGTVRLNVATAAISPMLRRSPGSNVSRMRWRCSSPSAAKTPAMSRHSRGIARM